MNAISLYINGGDGVVRVFRFPLLAWAFSYDYGVFWIGTGNCRALLRAPWCAPSFSERHGKAKHIQLGRGWRVRFFRLPI